MASSAGPPAQAASILHSSGRPVYGLSNEPEVQTAPGGSSWAGAPAWGMAPQVPGTHYAPGLGPFTSCLFAGWVPDLQAGPSGCAGLQVGSQARATSGGSKQPDERRPLCFTTVSSGLMGSPEGLPARGPEPLGKSLALWQDWGAQRLCGTPTPSHTQTQSFGPDQLIGAPLWAHSTCLLGPFSHRGTPWLFLVKPGPPSFSWLTSEPPRRLLTSSTPPFRDLLLEHDTPWNPIAPPPGGPLLDSLTPLPSLHPSSPAGLLVLPRLAPASGQCLSGSA